jgi:hypothetical protein
MELNLRILARISPDDYESVTESIGAGCRYWARGLTTAEWEALGEAKNRDETLHALVDNEADEYRVIEWHDSDYESMFLKVAIEVSAESMLGGYIIQAVQGGESGFLDAGYIDGDLGDAMLQMHAFGEIVYG